MNNQEVLDKVANHLLTQMEVSADEFGCKYRGPNGLKCAIGCLIPDEKYIPAMEGLSSNHVIIQGNLSNFLGDIKLLKKLQFIHDQHEPVEWRSLLETLANDYNLEINF